MKHKENGNLVCVKEVHLPNTDTEEGKMRSMEILAEVNTMKFLVHPNIVEYYNSFKKSGLKQELLIMMEYADGGSLQQAIDIQLKYNRENNIPRYFSEQKILKWFV